MDMQKKTVYPITCACCCDVVLEEGRCDFKFSVGKSGFDGVQEQSSLHLAQQLKWKLEHKIRMKLPHMAL
ncbi:hypothetical protein ANANG_G00139120 [Anguilla anguilla]|uniref:Uncharacterized protein n=1 Tax=Anguilla anguilla TaxID=7936 RepID=A0A9D3MDT3_ANGAN|nr:hypothetical protein ANANG_G00139120 [Anguilla anguilla]